VLSASHAGTTSTFAATAAAAAAAATACTEASEELLSERRRTVTVSAKMMQLCTELGEQGALVGGAGGEGTL
jgi:ABC-type hemin transport system substrate-binding protein